MAFLRTAWVLMPVQIVVTDDGPYFSGQLNIVGKNDCEKSLEEIEFDSKEEAFEWLRTRNDPYANE
jgi:uncharacterized protein YciI